MTYNFKKDHLKNSDLQKPNEKSMVNINNDEDQDIYISERSSISSSNDLNQTSSLMTKRLPTPTPSPPLSLPQKQAHNLRYPYNELQENGMPAATQFQLEHKEEKKKKKNIRKVPLGQSTLVPFPETKPPESGDNYYPYWYYYKVNNPDWIMRHRQTVDGQIIPHESHDPSQYAPQPALTTSSIKPREQPRKSRHNGAPLIPSNHDKQRHDHVEKSPSSSLSSHLKFHENHDNNHQSQRPSPKQFIPLKDIDNDEHQEQSSRRTKSQQRRKLKTENDWSDHYIQSISNKSPKDVNSLIITSSSLANRPKNRSKIGEKNSLNSDIDENGKHRHNHNPPTISSQENHHHHNHHHVRRRPPSGAHIGAEFQVVDVSFKKPERSPYFHQTRDSHQLPPSPPSIYNQSSYLPPIMRDNHHKTNTTRFPTEYYGTLARQAHGKDWEETIEIPKVYKPEPQIRFYDRYLNNVLDKRLAA